jgi:serine/threonine protein kinase
MSNSDLINELISKEFEQQYFEECKHIWQNYVPLKGKSNCLQGELLREIEKIRCEAQDNGNINWDKEFTHFCEFITQNLVNQPIFSENEKMFKIIDFGVSAFLDTENHTQLTKTGEHIAGGSFIDPILQQKPKIRDVRSDIYSVGAIWYFLLCGRAPSGSDMREYLEKSNSQITPTDIDIIMKCLSSSIENRYSSCEELLPIVKNAAMG